MRKRRGAVSAAALLLVLALPACDPAGGQPSATRSASASSSAPTQTASPTPSPSGRAAQVRAAQQQYITFYTAYVDAARSKPAGKPPESLLAMTDASGSADEWLAKAFAEGKKANVRVVGGGVSVTTGPEIPPGTAARVVIFNACHDQRRLRVRADGKPVAQSWLLGKIEMHASAHDVAELARPGVWKVFSMNQMSVGEPCEER